MPRPIIDVRVFRDAGFALVNVANLLVNLSMFSVLLLMPFYLARMAALSVPVAGLVLAAQPVGTMIAAPLAGRLAGRVAPRRMILCGQPAGRAGLAPIGFVGPQPQNSAAGGCRCSPTASASGCSRWPISTS